MRTRVKFHRFPGDISRAAMIRMVESRRPFYVFPWQLVGRNAIRSFRGMLKMRERATEKRRTERLIREQIETDD